MKSESEPNYNTLLLGGIVGAVELTVLSAGTSLFLPSGGLKELCLFVSVLLFPIGSWFGVAVAWAFTSVNSGEATTGDWGSILRICWCATLLGFPTAFRYAWFLALVLSIPVLLWISGAFMMLPLFLTLPLFVVQFLGVLVITLRTIRRLHAGVS